MRYPDIGDYVKPTPLVYGVTMSVLRCSIASPIECVDSVIKIYRSALRGLYNLNNCI